ncbi:MAG: SH3 domain-containing protein, partial [Clostridia bacterium]|nr:SH3 domain-containing protein [Clostridia bacterium]
MNFKKFLISCFVLTMLLACMSALATEWAAIVTKKSTVYASASTSSKVLGTVSKNQSLNVLDWKNGWAKVTLNGKVGYMDLDNVKKTTRNAYVNSATCKVYASYSTSSKVLATYAYGDTLKLEAISDGWARLVNGSTIGFCKLSELTFTNPNTMNITVYAQGANIKVYTAPTTSSKLMGTVNGTTKLTCLAITDDGWCRVKKGSYIGFIPKSDLGTTKHDGYSTAKMASGPVYDADWWKSDIRTRFAKGEYAIVTDVATGITFKVYRGGGTNHADVQPATAEDTRAMKKACGSDYGVPQ